jgi:hypothetical protein
MAKLLEGRAVVAHVGCCVFCIVCLCFVFCVVFERPFSYRRGRKLILAEAKWPTFVQSEYKKYYQTAPIFLHVIH